MSKRHRIYTIIMAALAAALLLTACQPTPDEVVVINKNDVGEEIKNSAEKSITVPDAWDEQVTNENGDTYIDVNAKISIPDTDAFCVMSVEPGKFSQEEVDKLVNYFSQGKPLSASNAKMTKTEIEARIIELKSVLSKAENGTEDYGTPEER